jgi:hypothetical protein
MNRNKSESAVDRLIALASDENPANPYAAEAMPEPVAEMPVEREAEPVGGYAGARRGEPGRGEPGPGGSGMGDAGFGEQGREMDYNPVVQALSPFRGLVPYISRMLEMAQAEIGPGPAAELKQTMSELQGTQQDLRVTVQEQLIQMKRLEEEVTHTREASERNAFDSSEMAEDLRSVHSLVKKTAGFLGLLLVVLIALVVYMVLKQQHLIP